MSNKNEDVTTKFKVDISEFRSGIKEANNIIKLANAQFKAATSGMDDWKNSTDGITAKIEQLNTILQAQKQKLNSYKQQFDALTQAEEENGKRAEQLKQQYNDAVNAFGKNSQEAKQLASALNQVEQEQARNATAANNMRIQILNQEAAVGNTERELRNYNSSLSELENASSQAESDVQDLADAAQEAGDSAEKAESGFSVLKGALADLVSQGINAAIDGFKELMTSGDQALNSFQAQTGKSSEEMKAFNEQIQDLYKNNYGESLEDIADSMAKVAQNTKETDPSKIKDLTQEALTLRDTFGYEVPESMRAVNMLMDQFGLTGEEAFNLIAQGAQSGLDKNEDLLDTINEYSVHFKGAGYSAEEMFNSLKNGTDAGTFSVDKLGDAVKEFGIRMKDGTADDSLKQLGLSVDDVTKRFAQGGEVGADAMGEVVDALFKIKDPLKQNTIGTQLFGTMWEDLGADGVKALMDINGEFDRTTDTMSEIDSIKYDDIGSQLQQLGRTVKTELLEPIVKEVLPPIKEGVNWLIQNSTTVCAAIAGIGAALATMAVANIIMGLVESFRAYKAVTEGATIAQWALNSAMLANPIGIIIALIVGLVAAFVVLWNKNEAFRNFFLNAWGNIKDFASNTIQAIKDKFSEWGNNLVQFVTTTIPNFIQGVGQWFSQLPQKIGYAIGFVIGKLLSWHIQTISFITTNVPKWISMIVQFFKQLPNKVWTWLVATVKKVVSWGTQMGSKAKETGTKFVNNVINFIKNLPSRVWQWLNSTIQKAINFATTFPQKGQKAANDFKNKLVNGLKSIPSKMGNIGKEIVRGIWSGITGAGGWLKSKISGFASSVVSGFKSSFKIKSPSRIMRDLIGRFIAKGIGVGIVAETKSVVKQANQFSTSVKDAIATNLSGIATMSPVTSLGISSAPTGLLSEIKEALSSLKISLPDTIKINLVLASGEILASVVAPFIDVIQGNNIILAERGLA